MRRLLLLLFIANYQLSDAQAPQSWTSAEMYQAIRKLNVLGSVLYIAAHPDDENTRLISWLSKDRLYRTGYLSMTRGDGGQNLIGEEQGIELGMIRTQELLAARRIDGGEQFFTRAYDFGFSKNPEETFAKWDKEKILADVVWVIRKFQPDVIINRFPTSGEGGHGHHTASGILANEAFAAAADPSKFPDQLKYVSVWQVKRVLWNTFNFGGNNTTRDDQLKIDVGGYNPLLGKSYGEIAAESRSQHKSQGFGVPAGRGEALEFFKATKGDQPSGDLMEGVDLTWNKVAGGSAIQKIVDEITASFDFLHPENSVKELVRLYKALDVMPASQWKNKKMEETKELILQCSGLFIDATASTQYAVQTDSVRVNFALNNRLGVNAKLQRVTIPNHFDSTLSQLLVRNRNVNFSKTFLVDADITQPYWLKNPMAEGYYNVAYQPLIGKPDVDPAFNAVIELNVEGEIIQYSRPVKYKFTDPVRGELYQPLVVIPSYTLKIVPEVVVVHNYDKYNFEKLYTSNKSNNSIKTVVPMMRKSQMAYVTEDSLYLGKESKSVIAKAKDENEKNPSFPPKTPNSLPSYSKLDTISYIDRATKNPVYDILSVKHDHIPSITYFKPAKVIIKDFGFSTYGKKIAYIPGAGDKVIESLEQMGYEVNRLTEKELSRNDLDKFDAIITGVRAYNTNEWLNKHHDKLMKYVEKGGNLIVQYNTSNQIGPVRARIAPYNFNISRTRVTDENAEVRILKPEHPVFNFPNKITQEDFKGWIQERSIYHASAWDSTKFETVISMNDPGEKADEGALIIAKHGKGYFTYTGLVFFRELPAGVPGAYRLLANLIALNRKKGF
jgi:LmbE family N-acetylglucosaminyl deacetylase